MEANTLETSVLGEVKLSRTREMRKTGWVGRSSWQAEGKKEMLGVNTEGFVALSTACPTAAWTLASVMPRDVHVHSARPEAVKDKLCWFI